jgi:hypothetical protein
VAFLIRGGEFVLDIGATPRRVIRKTRLRAS